MKEASLVAALPKAPLPCWITPPRYFLAAAATKKAARSTGCNLRLMDGAYVYGSYPDIDELFQKQAAGLDLKKRGATIDKIQQLVYEKAINAPIWQLGFLNGTGPRVGESGFGRIPGFAYTAPFEDITIKG